MRILIKLLKKYWYFAVLAAGFMVAEVYVDLYQPRMMATIVDDGILGLNNGGVSNLQLVISTGIKMLLVVLAGGICGMLSGVFSNVTGQNYGNDIRKACFRKIMHFSFEQTDDFSTGSLITRITSDVTQVQQLVMQMIRGFVRCLMFFVGGTTALLSLDVSFGVVVACAFPLILIDVIFVVWRTNPLFTVLQESLDKLNSIIQENVNGIRVVKAFIQEKTEAQRFDDANRHLVDTQFNVQMMMSFLRPVMNIVLNIGIVSIIYIGSIQVQGGKMAPGAVMAAITYISQILNGMMMLAMIFQTLSRGMASAKRLEAVITADPGLEKLEDGNVQPQQKGSVSFKNVSFVYSDNGKRVLRRINLDIAPGETVGIIGATGCGKTSLVSLIPRFYDAASGKVLVDGVDVRAYDLAELRQKVTVCLQKSELFSTTIRDNIAIGDPSASEEEIYAAARAAQADDFIRQQPEGYDTPVAEGGMSLSGGQRQRIAISRALLKKGEILIFDDSTSALDLRTEAALYAAVREQYADVTKIIIAQRVASVKNADRIVVLDNGTIAACGSHEQLLQTSAVYRDIYDSQLKDSEETEKGGQV